MRSCLPATLLSLFSYRLEIKNFSFSRDISSQVGVGQLVKRFDCRSLHRDLPTFVSHTRCTARGWGWRERERQRQRHRLRPSVSSQTKSESVIGYPWWTGNVSEAIDTDGFTCCCPAVRANGGQTSCNQLFIPATTDIATAATTTRTTTAATTTSIALPWARTSWELGHRQLLHASKWRLKTQTEIEAMLPLLTWQGEREEEEGRKGSGKLGNWPSVRKTHLLLHKEWLSITCKWTNLLPAHWQCQ